MILPKQPPDAPLGFKVRRSRGNWRVFKGGKPYDGRFQTITELPRGLAKNSGGMAEGRLSSVSGFTGSFD